MAGVESTFDRRCREYGEAKMETGRWMKTALGFQTNGRRSVGEEVTGAFCFSSGDLSVPERKVLCCNTRIGFSDLSKFTLSAPLLFLFS